MAAQDAVEGTGRAVNAYVAVFPHNGVDEAHMVGMVVGEHYSFDGVHGDSVAPEFLHDGGHVNPRVYQKPGVTVAYIGAVAGASAAERYEIDAVDGRYVFQGGECVVSVEQLLAPFVLFLLQPV